MTRTGHLMIFDIYVSSWNIVIEYHGIQHYHDHYMFGDVSSIKERDDMKRVCCICHNMTYLEVPYWWQRDKESIIGIIHQVRPDIVGPATLRTPFQYPKRQSNKEVSVMHLY